MFFSLQLFFFADTEGVSLLPIGLEAFLNYNPIRATTDPSEALDFYRSVRSEVWFVLTTRATVKLTVGRTYEPIFFFKAFRGSNPGPSGSGQEIFKVSRV